MSSTYGCAPVRLASAPRCWPSRYMPSETPLVTAFISVYAEAGRGANVNNEWGRPVSPHSTGQSTAQPHRAIQHSAQEVHSGVERRWTRRTYAECFLPSEAQSFRDDERPCHHYGRAVHDGVLRADDLRGHTAHTRPLVSTVYVSFQCASTVRAAGVLRQRRAFWTAGEGAGDAPPRRESH